MNNGEEGERERERKKKNEKVKRRKGWRKVRVMGINDGREDKTGKSKKGVNGRGKKRQRKVGKEKDE